MKIISTRFKISGKLIFYVLGLIIGCLLCALWFTGFFRQEKPMLDEDIDYLCTALNAEDEPVCNSNEKIYPRDFSYLITEIFDSPRTRFQDFQHVFAPYQTKLTVYEDTNVIAVDYDINRDGNWDLIPTFFGTFEDNHLRNILFRESFD